MKKLFTVALLACLSAPSFAFTHPTTIKARFHTADYIDQAWELYGSENEAFGIGEPIA